MRLKKSSFWSKIPNGVWLLISLAVAVALWLFAAYKWPTIFATPAMVLSALVDKAASGILWEHMWASLSRVLSGFAIAFVVSIPVAFLMAWYDPFRHVVEPWIQFIRNIPPLAYVFLIIAALGVGQISKVTVIFIAAFLVMVITIYQGVKGVDTTLIKAARVLGAKQSDIFFKVTIPASTPFILVAARLGLSTAMTTLMASEIVGGDRGLGMMIQQASSYFQRDVMLMGIILLGIIGICFEKIVRFLERRLTGWQETIQP
ncbi:ABC transporter permease [Flavonifractor plautii]|uniref:ABC transporter permease n=1 Tax=Flavonifractor plautii TaxID=292800 RepID=UPI000B388384|nr:ABC transporter permease [Flavonifractor plautii]MCB5376764.1 ABC transporter permease [Flavonifractor plautii]OUO83380.1 nitrate ABC transporter permease [Flavonifractor plautii]HJF01616.1 ABC transporter permease [Flavonifractor plautii]